MKVQIDTDAKTIKLENEVSIGKLIEFLERLNIDTDWKEYKLLTNTVIKWNEYPTIIYRDYHYPYNPYGRPYWVNNS